MKPFPLNKIAAGVALLGYIVLSVFSPLHLTRMASADMSMENCPYAAGEQSICPMDTLSHIRSWQGFTNVPLVDSEAGAIATPVLILALIVIALKPLLLPRRQRQKVVSLYQELFSSGILHPRAP